MAFIACVEDELFFVVLSMYFHRPVTGLELAVVCVVSRVTGAPAAEATTKHIAAIKRAATKMDTSFFFTWITSSFCLLWLMFGLYNPSAARALTANGNVPRLNTSQYCYIQSQFLSYSRNTQCTPPAHDIHNLKLLPFSSYTCRKSC